MKTLTLVAKKLQALTLLLIITSALVAGSPAYAVGCDTGSPSSINDILNRVACRAGLANEQSSSASEGDIAYTIGQFINVILSLTGIVFIILLIYAGYLWGTARGNENQVTEAEGLIRDAVIGIIVLFGAFSISRFVLYALKVGFTPGGV